MTIWECSNNVVVCVNYYKVDIVLLLRGYNRDTKESTSVCTDMNLEDI